MVVVKYHHYLFLQYKIVGDKAMEKRTMFIHNTKEETDTLSLRIPVSMKLRLSMIANQENRTINFLVNQILKEYIDNKNVKK